MQINPYLVFRIAVFRTLGPNPLQLSKRLTFLNEFLRNAGRTGSVTPSSRSLIHRMTRPLGLATAKVIVELGPGTGPMTRTILQRIPKDAKLLAFETNTIFCEELQKLNDPRLIVINDSAELISKYLKDMNLGLADCVLSSIPLTMVPIRVRMRIVSEVKNNLKPGGFFTQFQYSKTAQKVIRHYFKNVKIDFTPFNIPPAFIYVCKN